MKWFWRVSKLLIFIVLLFTLCSLDVYSQISVNQKLWHLTPYEGLSQSTVSAIHQDSEGFIWFGTQEGLNKYEGQNKNIVVYKHLSYDATTIGSNEIEDIYEDRQGNLWVAADWGGLNLYKRDEDNFKRFNATEELHDGSISDNTIHDIFEDSRGNLWVGTYLGLNLMNRENGTFENFVADSANPNSLSRNYITDIFEDSSGQIWVATNNGLNQMHRDSIAFDQIFITQRASFNPENYVNVIYEDKVGRFWVGTEGGLYLFNKEASTFKVWDQKITKSATILDIIEDEQGVVWVGTENEGLLAIMPDSKNSYLYTYSENNIQGLNSNSIYSLYQSKDNILWIGTFDGGLNVLNRKEPKFKHYRNQSGVQNSLNENSVMSFLKPMGNQLWIGTDGGGINLLNLDTGNFDFLEQDPQSLSNDVIIDLMEDTKGRIWIGTYNRGLSQYNPATNRFKSYRFDVNDTNSISHDQIFKVFEGPEGFIWAGTNGSGLNKLVDEEKGIFERWNPNSTTYNFEQSYIRDVHVDEEGVFWVTTYGAGVNYFNPKTGESKTYSSHEGNLSNSVVLDIFAASDGTIWVGTKGGGLGWYNKEKDLFEAYTTEDGLPNDIINAIVEDDGGNIWVSTNNGLSRFSPKDKTFKNFGLSDGLQSKEFKPGAAIKLDNGSMYFGGINGFNEFHPDSIREDTLVLPVAFTEFQLSNKTVDIGGDSPLKKQINQSEEIILPHNQTNFTIKYTVLNFNPEQEYSFAYMLEGFDEGWNFVSDQNSATYTNIDPGEYVFKVKAANSDGFWGSDNKQVKLIITPPFWQTGWFYLLSFLFVAGLIFGGYKYRTSQIIEQNKRLEEEVSNRTQELNQRNRELKDTLIDLENTREELIEKAHKAGMADIASGVLHNVGNILNSVNTSSGLIDETIKKSRLNGLEKANNLLRENLDEVEDFFSENGQGRKLLDYYLKLEEPLKDEQKKIMELSKRLSDKIKLINEVIAAQQSFATINTNSDTFKLQEIVEDALTLNSESSVRHHITIEKNYESDANILCQRSKLVHVLVNIYKNAKEAMKEAQTGDKRITITTWDENDEVYLSIADTGLGIKKEHLSKIFNQGFTTKAKGHGFGLHSSANYIKEMGGKISVQSDGEGKGAKFILRFKRV